MWWLAHHMEHVRIYYMARLNADIISNDIIITKTYKHYMLDIFFKAWFVQGIVVVLVFVSHGSMTPRPPNAPNP